MHTPIHGVKEFVYIMAFGPRYASGPVLPSKPLHKYIYNYTTTLFIFHLVYNHNTNDLKIMSKSVMKFFCPFYLQSK